MSLKCLESVSESETEIEDDVDCPPSPLRCMASIRENMQMVLEPHVSFDVLCMSHFTNVAAHLLVETNPLGDRAGKAWSALLVSSSACAERVFALYTSMLDSSQAGAYEDRAEASVICSLRCMASIRDSFLFWHQ
jgi:hypothetical protein